MRVRVKETTYVTMLSTNSQNGDAGAEWVKTWLYQDLYFEYEQILIGLFLSQVSDSLNE
jgi:hypothetical protein